MNMSTCRFNFFFKTREIHIHILNSMLANIRTDLTQLFPLRQFGAPRGASTDKATRRLLYSKLNTWRHMFAVFLKSNIGMSIVAHANSSFEDNRSTICIARMDEPALCSPPATFIKQPGSQVTTVSAPLEIMCLTLFSIIERLTSG